MGEWAAFLLGKWSIFEVLEYVERLSILFAVIVYFAGRDDRLKQKHYQAWQVINTAQGKGGSGGRIEALRELNRDGVPLVGADVAGVYLQNLSLVGASLAAVTFRPRICAAQTSNDRTWKRVTCGRRTSTAPTLCSKSRRHRLSRRRPERRSTRRRGPHRELR